MKKWIGFSFLSALWPGGICSSRKIERIFEKLAIDQESGVATGFYLHH
jgi:hypothetical protein